MENTPVLKTEINPDLLQLAQCFLFRGIPLKELARLCTELDVSREHYGPGQMIQERGRRVERLRLVRQGIVFASLHPGGTWENIDQAAFGPGRVLGLETALSSGGTAASYLMAGNTEWELIGFDPSPLLSDGSPPAVRLLFYQNWLHGLSDQTIRMVYWTQVLSQRTLREKILTFAAIMCSKSGSNSFTMNMNQSDFASYLRVARPSLNRELQLMKKDGLLDIRGRTYTVLRADQVRKRREQDQRQIDEESPAPAL